MSIQEKLRDQIAATFSSDELHDLCFDLNIDPDELAGETKTRIISALILTIAHQQQFGKLLSTLQRQRPDEEWPQAEEFSDIDWGAFIEAANLKGQEIYTGGGQVIIGDVTAAGDVVGRDKITIGNITDSYTAIGAGAQVLVTNIQNALSLVDESEKEVQGSERRLAAAIAKKVNQYATLTDIDEIDKRANPYKSLLDYELKDAPFFYGRSQTIQDMMTRLEQDRLTILHSDSGSGKTSLLQAGLASRLLASGHLPLYLRPYNQAPQQTIKKAFLTDYQTLDELARFRDENMSLKGFLERVTAYLGNRRLYIFLDQFEEFFTEINPEAQRDFAAQLRECVQSELQVWWILSLRKEYFSDLHLFTGLHPYDNAYFLPTFKLEEAQEVITKPALLKGMHYEERLVDQILVDIRGNDEKIQPAQVQLVCYTLFEELPSGQQSITEALYLTPRGKAPGTPGAQGILTSHLSQVLTRSLSGRDRKIAGRVLQSLVTSDKRRAVRMQRDIEQDLDDVAPEKIEAILTILHNNRLVRRDLDEDDAPIYQLTHDYLLTEIEIDPETQARKAAAELLAQEVNAYRLYGTLLSADKFTIINSQRDFIKVDETAQTVLDKSQAAIEAEARAKETARRRIVAGLAVGLLFVTVLAVLLFFSNQTAQGNATSAENNAATSDANEQKAVAAQETSDANANALGTSIAISEAETERAENAEDEAGQKAEEALNAQADAETKRLEAETQTRLAGARALAAEANQLLDSSEVNNGLVKAYQAMRATHDQDGTVTSEANFVMHTALKQVRPRHILEGHEGEVNSAAFNFDGTRIVTASNDGTARLWDEEGELITILEGHEGDVNSAVFNFDGTRIVTASSDGTAKLWDEEGALITTLEGHEGEVNSVAFNFDGTRIVTASDDGTARLWDGEGQFLITLEGRTSSVRSATFNFDGTRIVTASDGGSAKLWDGEGNLIATLEGGGTFGGNSAAFNFDGTRIVTADGDDTARLWDGDGNLIATLGQNIFGFNSAIFNFDGTRIMAASNDGTVTLWDKDGQLITTLEGHREGVKSVAFNFDGTRIVTASEDGTAKLWDGEGQLITTLEGYEGEVFSAAFNFDGTRIVTASSDGTARLWDGEGQPLATLVGHTGVVYSATFNFNGMRIITASEDGTAKLWDRDGELIITLAGYTKGVKSAAFNFNGTRIVTASFDATAKLWDRDGELITTLAEHTGRVWLATFNFDGTRIVTASSDGTAKLWDGEGQLLTTLEGHTNWVLLAAFNFDGTRIVTASSDGTAKLWDGEGQPLATLAGHTGEVNSAAFNFDGTRIVTASDDGTAKLWDGEGQLITTLAGHRGEVNSAAFNFDGTRIVTASNDGTAKLWNGDGQLLTTLAGHTSAVYSAAFNVDGTRIVTASGDGTAKLWRVYTSPDEMLAEAERKLRLVLPEEECTQLFDVAFCSWETDQVIR